MNEQDYELLSQFIDDELDRAQAQALRERLLAEPALRAELDRMKTVNDRVTGAFASPEAGEVPPALLARVRGAVPARRNTRHWGMAVAASVVAAAALLLAPQWRQADQRPDGTPAADALLAQVLENSVSRGEGWDTLADGRRVRPVLSFPDRDGAWCREYLLTRDSDTFRGVACRHGGRWQTEVLASAEHAGEGDAYRPAGAGGGDQVSSYIDARGGGIPLSLGEEAELIARNWQ
jgi:hypothetical protein